MDPTCETCVAVALASWLLVLWAVCRLMPPPISPLPPVRNSLLCYARLAHLLVRNAIAQVAVFIKQLSFL